MAKVGILTMRLGENIGGIMQAYALYSLVEEMGHIPYLIILSQDKSKAKGYLRKIFQKNPFYKIYDVKKLGKRYHNSKALISFVDKAFVNRTKEIWTQSEFERIGAQFDAIIVGSDQVWRYAYVGDRIGRYFLKGIKHPTKKIAYAASFGISEWECHDNRLNKELEDLLQQFDCVSVREHSGLDILRDTFHYNKGHVCLDPTLLHPVLFYDNLIKSFGGESNIYLPNSKYLFAYILDLTAERVRIINEYASSKGLKVVFSSIPTHTKSLSPVEWLAGIRGAEVVVTDSFHGTVFSFIYQRPCICLQNKDRGNDRFATIIADLKIRVVVNNVLLKGNLLSTSESFQKYISNLIAKSQKVLSLL